MNRFGLLLFVFLCVMPSKALAQKDLTWKLRFGSGIDSVYNVLSARYGAENVTSLKGSGNPFTHRADADSMLCLNKGVVLFDNQSKMSRGSLFCFQKNPDSQRLCLSQIIHVICKFPHDFSDLIPKMYDSYYSYFSTLYDDIECYRNDYGQECFRFGKGLYSWGTWFGTYYVTKDDKYDIFLIFTVPQNG